MSNRCDDNFDCGAGRTCVGTRCVAMPTPACDDHDDCGAGSCVKGRCDNWLANFGDIEFRGGAGAGCGTTGGAGTSGWAGLLLVALGALGFKRRAGFKFATAALAAVAMLGFGFSGTARAADAESAAFEVQQFRPLMGARDVLGVESALTVGHLGWGIQLFGNYASLPLVARRGDTKMHVLDDQTTFDIGATIGFFDFLELSVVVPYTAQLSYSEEGALLRQGIVGDSPESSLNGIRIAPKATLLKGDLFALGLAAPIEIPIAYTNFQMPRRFTVNPRLMAELGKDVRVLANAGFVFRKEATVRRLTVGNAITYGLGAELPIVENLALQATAMGEIGVENMATNNQPLEAIGALKWNTPVNLAFTVGGGVGILEGYGSPEWRVLAGLGYVVPGAREATPAAPPPAPKKDEPPPPPPPPPEPLTLADKAITLKPREAAALDVAPEVKGAPAGEVKVLDVTQGAWGTTSIDEKGIVHYKPQGGYAGTDQFVVKVGDKLGRVTMATVSVTVEAPPPPPKDTDGDGIIDDNDKCITQPETYNGYQDEDGCPDTPPKKFVSEEKVKIVGSRLFIYDQVFFATGKADILPKSFGILNAVADVLKKHPHVKLIRIEGHTDNVGNAAKNLALSKNRAASVKLYLTAAGVEETRLVSEGYGQTQPIVPNTTAKNKALNRRVAFTILDQEVAE